MKRFLFNIFGVVVLLWSVGSQAELKCKFLESYNSTERDPIMKCDRIAHSKKYPSYEVRSTQDGPFCSGNNVAADAQGSNPNDCTYKLTGYDCFGCP